MERIRRGRFKPKAIVELGHVLPVGMCNHRAHPYGFGYRITSKESVLHQRATDSTALMLSIHGNTGNDQDGNRALAWLTLEKSLRRVIWLHLSNA